MSVKLLLNPAADSRACVHPDTGVTFMIRPISPEQYDEIYRKSLNKDKGMDLVKRGANFAVAAIEDWGDEIGDKNGPLPCTEENLRTFGRNQAINIMPWIIDQACSLDQFRIGEETNAKNA